MRDLHDDGNFMRLIGHRLFYGGRGIVVVAVGVFLMGWVSGAGAQTAGGDGRVLDSNQSTTQGKTNGLKKRFLLNNINNAIVTGNVAGGKGFRGDLGYTAAGDFRGQAGSDDLFSFSADSYMPGLIFERTNLLQVPTTRGITNARYRSGLQPTLILRRSSAGESYSSRPFTHLVKRRETITGDPSGALGQVNQSSLLRRSMTDVEFQKRYTSQYRYSVSISRDVTGVDVLPESALSRLYTVTMLQSLSGRSNTGKQAGYPAGKVTEVSAKRSYLDLFGMISGQKRGRDASERGLPDTDDHRGTPSDRIRKELEKIDGGDP